MDVSFSDDQELLRKSAREFLTDQCPSSVVREVIDKGAGAPGARDLWKKMADLGWMGLAFGEDHGGVGLTLVDLAILAEEMGRTLVPVPWFSTVCLAGEAIRMAGTDEQKAKWLSRIASGEIRATLALLEPDGKLGPQYLRSTATAADGGFRLSGVKAFVPDAAAADAVVVAASLDGEPALFVIDAAALDRADQPTLDETRKLGKVDLTGVEVGSDALLGAGPCGWEPIERALDRATAILCAEMCGGSQRVLELSIDYAKQRHQFGRAIGSFQGVSHRCADMLLRIESVRSLTYYAAWCNDEDESLAPLATSSAKAAAGDTYKQTTADAIQIHGGVGFTWEVDLHLWYRRAFWSAAMFGDSVYHRERVASLLNL